MIKIILLLALVLGGLFVLGYNVVNPDGYVDTLTDPTGITPSWEGANPFSQITDPMIDWINTSLGTRWGFVILLTVMGLIMAYFRTSLIGSLGLSYIVYVIGSHHGFPYLSWICLATLIGSGILIWFGTGGKKKADKTGSIILGLLLLIIGVVALLTILSYLGFVIPGWN